MKEVAPPDGDFPSFLSKTLHDLAEELRQAHQCLLARHLAEQRRLAEEVAHLQAELLSVRAWAAPAPAPAVAELRAPPVLLRVEDDEARESLAVAQPRAAVRPVSFLAHDSPNQAPPAVVRIATVLTQDEEARPTSSQGKMSEKVSSEPEWVTGSMELVECKKTMTRQVSQNSTVLSMGEPSVLTRRLLARLGHLRSKGLVRGRDVHQAISALGLEKYSVKEVNNLIHLISVGIQLRFRDPENKSLQKGLTTNSKRSFRDLEATTHHALAHRAEWRWPYGRELDMMANKSSRRPSQTNMVFRSLGSVTMGEEEDDHADKVVPWKALMELFTKDEAYLKKLLGPGVTNQVYEIREVLVTGEANRLISQLTFVKIDDLATRRRRNDPLVMLDIVVGIMIILNSIQVGMLTEPTFESWGGWMVVTVFFSVFFAAEIAIRLRLEGWQKYLCGPEKFWNASDMLLALGGVVECLTQLFGASRGPSPAMLRFIRVARLSRLVRVFRLKFMLELRLMIKGLLSGIRTMFWAFVLLTFCLYALGVVTATLFSNSTDENIHELFSTVTTSMFTTFRCVSGDCFTRGGSSLTCALFNMYGLPFAVCFVVAYMMITLGLFNVILAIYVDTIMVAAKQTEDANKGRHEYECIRVAHITKRLLKMFCAAYRYYNDLKSTDKNSIDIHEVIMSVDKVDVEIDDDIQVSKELYLLVIQDPEVQKLMDDLDIPVDRAKLFDNIDADGSGRLQIPELVRGLLKVRGEVNPEQIACVLVLRSIQSTLKQVKEALDDYRNMLVEHLEETEPPVSE